MIDYTPYDAVNWVDGMKISQKHFDAQTNFVLDGLREVRAVFCNALNYGLLPLEGQQKDASFFAVYGSITGDLEVVVKHCRAVTPSGFRIDLVDFRTSLKALVPTVGEELGQNTLAYYLIVSVNPFAKVPFGTLDLEETPPRYPFTKSSYRMELVSVDTLNQGGVNGRGNFILLGKVRIQGDTLETDEHFIPPCTSMLSHPLLLNCYHNMAKTLPLLQKYAVKILQKNISERQNTNLGSNVKRLCQALIHDIGSSYYQFRNIIPHAAPVYFIGCFSQMAVHLYQVTTILAAADLEEMLNYLGEWSEIAPHVFLRQLSAVAEIKYIHENCGEHLTEIQLFISSLEKVFLKLSELDYIGQRKENIIVNEQEVTPPPKSNRGWSVLD